MIYFWKACQYHYFYKKSIHFTKVMAIQWRDVHLPFLSPLSVRVWVARPDGREQMTDSAGRVADSVERRREEEGGWRQAWKTSTPAGSNEPKMSAATSVHSPTNKREREERERERETGERMLVAIAGYSLIGFPRHSLSLSLLVLRCHNQKTGH